MSSATRNPPNILVFGEDGETWKNTLLEIVDPNRYSVYTTTAEELSSGIWVDNCSLLLVSKYRPVPQTKHQVKYNIHNYMLKAGTVIFCSSESPLKPCLAELIPPVVLPNRKFFEATEETGDSLDSDRFGLITPSIAKYEGDGLDENQRIFMECLLELGISCEDGPRSEPMKPTKGYVVTDKTAAEIKKLFISKASEEAYELFDEANFTSDATPVVLASPDPSFFNTKEFLTHLKTKHLGRTMLFTRMTSSTMASIKAIQSIHGALAVATAQSKGAGRGRNVWISPKGCAMFTLSLRVDMESRISDKLSLVQHLMALAIVKAIRGVYPHFQSTIKWPNDIYFKRELKLGGILCTGTLQDTESVCHVGVGVNISNGKPTVCVNDVAESSLLTVERFIGDTLTEFEKILEIHELQPDDVLREYHNYWLHSGEKVQVKTASGLKEAKVRRINDCGFLVADGINGEVMELQPDGNSFDLIKGLITTK